MEVLKEVRALQRAQPGVLQRTQLGDTWCSQSQGTLNRRAENLFIKEPFSSTQGKQQKLDCMRLFSSSDLPHAGGRAKQLCSAPSLLTLRNLWRRKANQFVSIFSATDSVLGKPGGGEAHYQQNQILAQTNLRKQEWPETGGEEHPAPHSSNTTAQHSSQCTQAARCRQLIPS